jgi:hypothetical protein
MSRSGFLAAGAVTLFSVATAASVQAATVYDAAGDYLAGWTAGNNPNEVWTYGWSTTAGVALTLYTAHGEDVVGFPQLDSWSDPANRVNNVPDVYLNTGPALTANSVDNLPAGALALHGGGNGTFSEVVWTAPGTGLFNLATTFTGRQFGLNGLVEILDISGGVQSTLLSGSIADQTSQSLTQQISVNAGDKLVFAARANPGSNGDTTQLVATLTSVSQSNIPEPSTFGLILAGLGWVGYRRLSVAREPVNQD